MDDKIINFQEYENFLIQNLKILKTNFPYDIVEFVNLEKNEKLDKNKFLELLPQINYNNIQFYENRIKELEENKITNLNEFLFETFKKIITRSNKSLIESEINFLEIILKKSDIVNFKNEYKNPLLHEAIENVEANWFDNDKKTNIIKILINYGVDINIKNYDNVSALELAISKNDIKSIKLLINSGIEIYENNLIELFDVLVDNKDYENTKLLINKYNFHENHREELNLGLFTAVFRNDAKMIKLLTDYGANVNIQNNYDLNTLLHEAIWRDNRWWSFEALLKADANVNIQNKDGETPLHFAAKSSHYTHSKWNKYQLFYDLLNHGANVNIKNKNGKTAIDLCQNTNLKLILQNAQKVQEPWEEIDFKSFENLDLQNQPSTSKSPRM